MYKIVSASDFASQDIYRVGYDSRDRVGHLAKFSKKTDGIIMTNTSPDKAGVIYFFSEQEARDFAEKAQARNRSKLYDIIVQKGKPGSGKRLAKGCPRVLLHAKNTRFGMGWQLIPIPETYDISDNKVMCILLNAGKTFLMKNDLVRFFKGIDTASVVQRYETWKMQVEFIKFFVVNGVDVDSVIDMV